MGPVCSCEHVIIADVGSVPRHTPHDRVGALAPMSLLEWCAVSLPDSERNRSVACRLREKR
jgi:hypothetical protein